MMTTTTAQLVQNMPQKKFGNFQTKPFQQGNIIIHQREISYITDIDCGNLPHTKTN